MKRWKGAALVVFFIWSGAEAFGQVAGNTLRIVVTHGEKSVIDAKHSPEVVIRVEDGRGMPVSGADITFKMPDGEAGGYFAGGSKLVTVKSNDRGLASSGKMRPGLRSEPFVIAIRANFQGFTATQYVQAGASAKGGRMKWYMAAGAGVAAGTVLAMRGRSNSVSLTPAPTTKVTVGAPTVGQPQ